MAIITGGGSGIGAATATALAREKWSVVLVGRRADALERVSAKTGGLVVTADVRSLSDGTRIIAETDRAYGRTDGLVLDAGVALAGGRGLPDRGLAHDD